MLKRLISNESGIFSLLKNFSRYTKLLLIFFNITLTSLALSDNKNMNKYNMKTILGTEHLITGEVLFFCEKKDCSANNGK